MVVDAGFARTTSGLLYRSDGTLSGWTGAVEWTSAADPRFICHPTGVSLLAPDARVGEQDGVREPQLYIESGVWWLLYDAGEGLFGWKQRLARSTDRGRTWERVGLPGGLGLAKKTTGNWAALATGWLEKRGSTYYLHRVTSGSTFGSPNVGLTANPYFWDCWTSTTVDGSRTASANVPGDNYTPGGAFSVEFLPGCVVKSGASYIAFVQGSSAGSYVLGVCAGVANPDGPFTAPATSFASGGTVAAFGSRQPENPKVFYSATLNRWICLTNLIAASGVVTDANAAGYSTSLTDWSGAVWHRTQRMCPADGGQLAVGLACHVTGPDGALVEGPGGEVPVLFDGYPKRYSPGWHLGRECAGAVLEPSTTCLRIAQSANQTQYQIRRALSLTDFVAEFSVEFTAMHASGGAYYFAYRMNSAGTAGYRLNHGVNGLSLGKIVGGVESPVGTPTRTVIGQEARFAHRIRVQVVGNRHRLYLDGELQIDFTDSSSPIASGTHIELIAFGMTGDVRNLTVYASDTVTVTGLVPGASVEVRGYGDLPVAAGVAGADGSARVSLSHWPHYSLETGGSVPVTSLQPLWGGDVVAVSYTGGAPVPPQSVPVRARR